MEEVRETPLGFSFLFCSYGYQELNEGGQACAAGTLTDWPSCQPRLNPCYLNFTNKSSSYPTFHDTQIVQNVNYAISSII